MDLNHPLLAASDDPPPFPSTHTQLQRLDRALFCQICKESYQAPVTIACGHSFCSQCIRSALDTIKKCPTCGDNASEGSIRRNRALEEIVDSWQDARPVIITLTTPIRKREKRKRDSASSCDTPDAIEIISSGEVLTENGQCPICSARLSIASIPMHIERGCPAPKANRSSSSNQKADWKKVFGGVTTEKLPLKRITKPNYHLATPAELKSILSTYSLPTTGDKPTLEARVQDWILLYNSNLDTSHPKSLSALRARLTETESSRKKDRDKSALGEQLASKEGVAKYAKERQGEFEKLRKEIVARKNGMEEKGKGKEEKPIEID